MHLVLEGPRLKHSPKPGETSVSTIKLHSPRVRPCPREVKLRGKAVINIELPESRRDAPGSVEPGARDNTIRWQKLSSGYAPLLNLCPIGTYVLTYTGNENRYTGRLQWVVS